VVLLRDRARHVRGRRLVQAVTTTLQVATAPHVRSEKAEEHRCDTFAACYAGRDRVVRFSQPRHTMQTLGIPDRRYRLAGVAFWFEVKHQAGRLRTEQVEFLEAELAYGCPAACGTLDDLVAYVSALVGAPYGASRVALACELGKRLIEKYRVPAKVARRGKLR